LYRIVSESFRNILTHLNNSINNLTLPNNLKGEDMGKFNREVKAFGREFARQGKLLLFGPSKHHTYNPRRQRANKEIYRRVRNARRKAYQSYNKAQRWARRNGFK
jgi:hypothetical protein